MTFRARTYGSINLRSWERMVAYLAGPWILVLQETCLYLMNFASSPCIDGSDMGKVGVRFGNR